jgi:hypothetical protein
MNLFSYITYREKLSLHANEVLKCLISLDCILIFNDKVIQILLPKKSTPF